MAKSTTPRVGVTRWTSGSDTVSRTDFDNAFANIESRVLIYSQGPLSSRPPAGSQGRFYVVSGDTAESNGRTFYDNGSQWVSPNYISNALADASSPTAVPLTVRSLSTTSVDTFRVENSVRDPLLRITNTGGFTTQGNSTGVAGSPGVNFDKNNNTEPSLSVVSAYPAKPVVAIRGAVGQSAALLSVRDSNNAVVASIAANGATTIYSRLTVSDLTVLNGFSTGSIDTSQGGVFPSIRATSTSGSVVPLVITGAANQTANLAEFLGVSGLVTRITSDGNIATDRRVSIGTLGSGSATFAGPNLVVTNSIGSEMPAARFVGFAGQGAGNVFEIYNGNNNLRYSLDVLGNSIQSGRVTAASVVGGGTTLDNNLVTAPALILTATTPFDSPTPALSIGPRDGTHMQFSAASINAYSGTASTATAATLNLGNNGGNLNLGTGGGDINIGATNSAYVAVRAPRFVVSNSRAIELFGSTITVLPSSVGSPPSPKENDIWFDTTENKVKFRISTNQWVVA